MNYNISELNELAQTVSHCLKHLNPKTMFWHTRNAVAFTNHDCFKVQPYRELKKPFGKLAVLESFARSLGFNTYNGLMQSGTERFELGKNALIDLNPNPLNHLLTDCWEEITRCLMERLFQTEILTPNRLGNFKQSPLSQYAIFTSFSDVSPFSWFDPRLGNNSKYKLDEAYKGRMPMMGIADVIFHKGLEAYIESKGMKQWFESPEIDEQAYLDFSKKYQGENKQDVVVVKLADFLVKKEGIGRHYFYLVDEVRSTLSLLYGTKLELDGGMKNGKPDYSEIGLNFHFSPAQISKYMSARIAKHNHRNYQTACSKLIEKYKDDNTLYACIEPLNAFEMGYTGRDWLNKNQATGLKGVDADTLGKKVYWVNTSVHSFISYGSVVNLDEGMRWVKTIPVESYILRIEQFLDEQLEPVEVKQIQIPPRIVKAKYEYKYNLIGQGAFTDRFPECMMVMSDYPLKYHLGELFVQTVLLNSIGFDEYKFTGKPDLLALSLNWNVMIQQTKSVRKAQECHYFNPIALLRSLFLYVDCYESGIYKEDNETVSFNIGLKFIDVLYSFLENENYENVQESSNLLLPMYISINKQTKALSVLSCGEYSISHFEVNKDIGNGSETCPMTAEIAHYLMQFDELRELISKFCLRFYSGDKREAYEEAIKWDDMDFEIRPVELLNKGLSLDEIANSAPYKH